MLNFPNIDPVAISLGPVDVRWYGISYVAGILLAWLYSRHLIKRYSNNITLQQMDDFMVWATIGIVAGGRLGWAIFYMPVENYARFWEVLYIWTPGMSFHGGLIGVSLATILFCRSRKLPMLSFGDILGAASPIGLLFGRIANFINGELYGRVTDVSWGIVFPSGGDLPRHPSQIYEAILEGFVLFLGLAIIERLFNIRKNYPGMMFSLFLMGYALARSIIENYREPDAHLGFYALGLTMGQFLSAPVMIAGLCVFIYSWTHKKSSI